jgi:hypothetical protein
VVDDLVFESGAVPIPGGSALSILGGVTMNSRPTCVLVTALFLCLLALPALAQREAIVKKISDKNLKELGPADFSLPAVACVVGNTNAGAYALQNWFFPPEDYYFLFDPTVGCGVCPTGFQVTQIRFLVQIGSTAPIDTCEMDVQASFTSAEHSNPSCPTLTTEECVAPLYTAHLDQGSGVYEIGLPLDCQCASKSYLYGIGIHLAAIRCVNGGVPDIVTDSSPTLCTSWDFATDGDYDLVSDWSFPGNIVFRADAQCCEPYVGTESSSWGAVKGLFHH